jgi:hypothetical protein
MYYCTSSDRGEFEPSNVLVSRMEGGNPKPEIYLAREINADLRRHYSPDEAQNSLGVSPILRPFEEA